MRLGILIPHRQAIITSARRPPVEECWTIARMADVGGMDLWVGDSIVAKPRLEPLTTLAYLAAITKHARLGTAVLLPALRQPTVLAHALANIDQISQGRLVLGLGVGWALPEIEREWEACGRNHKHRVRDLEEHIAAWRMLWSGKPVSYQGNGFKLTEHTIGPLPWTEKGPPILITAGNRQQLFPAQLERFARYGDGIITTYLTDDDIRDLRNKCDEALARHGRELPGFPLCVYTTVRMDEDVARAQSTTAAFIKQYYGTAMNHPGLMGLGPADKVIETLKRYEAAGVTDLCIRFAGADQIEQLEQFIERVVPAFAMKGERCTVKDEKQNKTGEW